MVGWRSCAITKWWLCGLSSVPQGFGLSRLRSSERASTPTTKAGPSPAAVIPRGDGAVISDNEDDSSVESGSSESERGVGNNNAYDNDDDGSLPPPVNVPEGAPPAESNIDAGPC